mmetsp:Transcript_24542/g.62148  ORF Transcript_24542/g.62148 Transcript_24542/m.62148 type:complete len:297 (+) Transcript_24542:717-1607(+)
MKTLRAKYETKLSKLLENETWTVVEGPAELGEHLDRRCEERKWKACSVGFIFVRLMIELDKFFAESEVSQSDVMMLLCDCLRLFNSRSCQLVLGAAAVQTAGLKSITVKNLCVAAETLGMVAMFASSVMEGMLERVSARPTVQNAMKIVKKDVREHRKEIFTKIATIMSERVHAAGTKITPPTYSKLEANDDGDLVPSSYMKSLVKDTNSLTKVLSNYLDANDRARIMKAVHSSFDKHILAPLQSLDTSAIGRAGHQQVCIDVQYLAEKLKRAEGFGEEYAGRLEHILGEKFGGAV